MRRILTWFIQSSASILILTALGAWPIVQAQQDTRAVRIVVPAPPGGSLDGGARVLAQRLTAITGEQHVVDNRPGANTIIGVEHVVRAPPDGRTLLYAGTSLVINASLQKLPYVPLADLRPVIAISQEEYALLATPQLKANGVRNLAALATARPGGLNCAAPPGAMGLGCDQLKRRLNGALTSVPFAGVVPALTALGGGHVDMVFVPLDTAAKLVDGKLADVLAVSKRPGSGKALGDGAPLITDLWPGFLLVGVQGIYVPARTPEALVEKLHRDLSRILSEPESMSQLVAIGQVPRKAETPGNFAREMGALSVRYSELVKNLGLAPP